MGAVLLFYNPSFSPTRIRTAESFQEVSTRSIKKSPTYWPINRGVELASDVANGPNRFILRQVSYGLAIRMAVLFLLNQTSET